MRWNSADAIVVGAGVSGLAAARSLSRAGLRVILLEGSALVGGRIRTVHVPNWSMPIELGAEFVHGEPSTTIAFAEAHQLALRALPDVHAKREGGALVAMDDPWSQFAAALGPAEQLGASWSVERYLERERSSTRDAELVRLLVEGFHAAPLNDVCAKVIAEDARRNAGSFTQFRVNGGYERLIKKLEQDLDSANVEITLQARVRRVEWEPGSVRVTVKRGEEVCVLQAASCLLTVSIGVLQAEPAAGGIEFEPALSERRAALNSLAMGQVQKVVLRLRTLPQSSALEAGSKADFFHDPAGAFPTLWLERSDGQVQVTAWAGGPQAARLSGRTFDELCALAVHSVADVFGVEAAALRSELIDAHSHDFGADPLFRGAYSYVRPGGVLAARGLSLPRENTLFFGGEALDFAYPGTVAGALGSGQHAARQILAATAEARTRGSRA